MALLGREFIAVPDSHKNQLVYKWPDVSIRRYTRAIVAADELALFVNTGKVVQTMGPGRHQIDADELPGLGMFVDLATAGRAYRAELFFVANREFPGFTFGGRIDDVQDPQTGLIVTLRVFGDYAVRVTDPIVLITNLLGTVDVTDNSRISNWVSDQLLKVMRTDITTQIVRNGWPILGLSAYTEDIERSVIARGNEQLTAYGVAITRMGNFDINLSPEDSTSLKKLARDTSYSRLAGSFNQYAAGEMQLGAGEGMAQGGGAVVGRLPRRRTRHRWWRRGPAVPACGTAVVRFRRRGCRRLPGPTPRRRRRAGAERVAGRPGAPDRDGRGHGRMSVLPGRKCTDGKVLPELRTAHGAAQGSLHELQQRVGAGREILRRVRNTGRRRLSQRIRRRRDRQCVEALWPYRIMAEREPPGSRFATRRPIPRDDLVDRGKHASSRADARSGWGRENRFGTALCTNERSRGILVSPSPGVPVVVQADAPET